MVVWGHWHCLPTSHFPDNQQQGLSLSKTDQRRTTHSHLFLHHGHCARIFLRSPPSLQEREERNGFTARGMLSPTLLASSHASNLTKQFCLYLYLYLYLSNERGCFAHDGWRYVYTSVWCLARLRELAGVWAAIPPIEQGGSQGGSSSSDGLMYFSSIVTVFLSTPSSWVCSQCSNGSPRDETSSPSPQLSLSLSSSPSSLLSKHTNAW